MGMSLEIPNEVKSKKIKVYVNVYDIINFNKKFRYLCLGIYHSGVVIKGKEYCFIGLDQDATGVYEQPLGSTILIPGPEAKLYKTIYMGESKYTYEQILDILEKFKKQYRGRSYNLLKKNCNNFSNDFVYSIVGKKIPSFINRMSRLCCLCYCCFSDEMLGIGTQKEHKQKCQQNPKQKPTNKINPALNKQNKNSLEQVILIEKQDHSQEEIEILITKQKINKSQKLKHIPRNKKQLVTSDIELQFSPRPQKQEVYIFPKSGNEMSQVQQRQIQKEGDI